jgi:phosphoribosyl 1,2-cyclic phosphate phosphodiesterase
MCIETVLEAQREFRKENILKEEGRIVVTHFSHNSKLLHDEFDEIFKPAGVVVAYDGLILYI